MIRLSDAREIILLARSVGIEPIVDGGWSVDAPIGCLATQARASTLSYGTWRPPPHSYRRPHEERDGSAIRAISSWFIIRKDAAGHLTRFDTKTGVGMRKSA